MSPQTNEHRLINVVICFCISLSALKKLRTRQSDLYFQWNLASSHFVRCGCVAEPVKPSISNEAVHVRE